MTGPRVLREWRVFVVVAAVLNIAVFILDAASGGSLAPVPAVAVALLVVTFAVQTKVIRVIAERERPRPDYAAIARLERDIYGETFTHDGAPAELPGTASRSQCLCRDDD